MQNKNIIEGAMKIDKGDIFKFLLGFVVGVGITSLLSVIVARIIRTNEENKGKHINAH